MRRSNRAAPPMSAVAPFAAVALLALACASAPPAEPGDGAVSPAYRASVRELMRATGALRLGEQMANAAFQAVMDGMLRDDPNVSPRAIEIAKEVAGETYGAMFGDEEKLLDAYAAIYARYFTQQEIDGLVAHYRSPLGRKAVKAMPQVLREGMALGKQWGLEAEAAFAAELRRRLSAEGLLRE